MDPGRRAHYGDFYAATPPGGPLALVHGNCQAESLRVVLATSPTFPFRTVRMPPVHELTASDISHLHTLLGRTALLVSQPVRDDYRDLPLGTAQLAARLPGSSRVLRWPVIRNAAPFPFAAIVRHARDMSAVPPLVPYHDLRTIAAATGHRPASPPPATALRQAARMSVDELARRERHTDVGVSDLLIPLGAAAAHTLNHPGNPVLIELARRIQRAAGSAPDAIDPGRTLLGGIRAPLERPVVTALGLAVTPRDHWIVDGVEVDDADVRSAHLTWYAAHPEWVGAALERHAERMALLLTAPSGEGPRPFRRGGSEWSSTTAS